MLTPTFQKNDTRARILIYTFSVVVFAAVVFLSNVKFHIPLPFDPHIFAKANAVINSLVSILLIGALVAIKQKNFLRHKNMMLAAMWLSILFLVSYIAHHLLAGETRFGDLDHNNILSETEKANAGSLRYVYYILLLTHIPLAAIILPFILFTAYRSLTGEFEKHKKLAKYTWPLWLYVSVTGVLVYFLIAPYYA